MSNIYNIFLDETLLTMLQRKYKNVLQPRRERPHHASQSCSANGFSIFHCITSV